MRKVSSGNIVWQIDELINTGDWQFVIDWQVGYSWYGYDTIRIPELVSIQWRYRYRYQYRKV